MAGDNPLDNARTRVVDSGAPLALAIGTLLGRYRIDGVLGQGGFGITYRATDTALNRAVAIKEYLPSDVAIRVDGTTVIPRSRTDAEDYDWGLKRFLDEAKTLAQHEAVPNVVRVYDFVEANGTAYMVMALVEGENLSAILRRRGTLSEQELLGIVLPLLDGLEQLHEAGLIHRDIKPANIILRGGRTPTLIDFGAAREGLGRKSRSVTSILTPGYAPFEQYGSAGDQGPWTDIYALAATLYHGVAGKAPPDSVDRIRRDPIVPAVQAGAGEYSERFLLAVDAGLKVDERERPQNAGAWRALFASDASGVIPPPGQPTTILQPALQQPVSQHSASQQPVSQTPISQPVSQSPMSQPAPSARATIEPPPPPSILAAPPAARAPRKMLIAAGAAILLIGGGIAVALTLGGSPQTAKPDQASAQLAEAEKKRAAELEQKLAEEAESRKKLEAQVAEAEARRKAEEEARRKAAEEARLKAEAEAREKAEAENRRRIEEDTRKKVEAETRAKAEEEARKRGEDETRRKAEEAKKKAEDEARKTAEQQKASDTQVATASPSIDLGAFEAKHSQELRRRAEQILARGATYTVPASGYTVNFRQLTDIRVFSVTPAEVALDVYYTVAGSRADLETTERASIRLRNQPGFPLVSANYRTGSTATSTQQIPTLPQQQTAAAAPAGNRTLVEAQHGTVLRQRAEQALRARGPYTDMQSGAIVAFSSLNGIEIMQVTATEVTVRASYNAQERSGFQRTHIHVSQLMFRNQPPTFPLIAAGQPSAASAAPSPQAPQNQVASAAPISDAVAYVAQHWPTSLRPKVETALKARGIVTDTGSGTPMRFDQIYSYRVLQVTPAQIVLAVTYRNMRAVPGGGNMTGTSADVTETATFQNQPSDFPLISLK